MTATTQLMPLRCEMPTVTLEVMAREAAISQWSDCPVVEVLRFQLQIQLAMTDAGAEDPELDPWPDSVPLVEIRGDRDDYLRLSQAVQRYVQDALVQSEPRLSSASRDAPYLEPQGLTQHYLHWPKVAAAPVNLGALQLADLAAAFAQLDHQVRVLPVPLVTPKQRRPWRQWGALAAGTVFAVGVTATLWSTYRYPPRSTESVADGVTAESDLTESEALEQIVRSPSLDPADSSLAAADPAPTERPDNSDPEAATDVPIPKSRPPEPDTTRPEVKPSRPTPSLTSAPEPASGTLTPGSSPYPEAPPVASPPDARVTDSSPGNITLSDQEVADASESAVDSRSGASQAPASSVETAVTETPTPPPQLPNDSPLSSQGQSPITAGNRGSSGGNTRSQGAEAIAPPQSPEPVLSDEYLPSDSPQRRSTLDELAVQIAERWRPPENIDQSLVYILVLSPMGTLAEIRPQNEAAERYRDRAGLPELGTQVLVPGEPQQLQVQLFPDGEVVVEPAVHHQP